MLAKMDIQNAFRLLAVHPTDRHLLGMSWTDGVYNNNNKTTLVLNDG